MIYKKQKIKIIKEHKVVFSRRNNNMLCTGCAYNHNPDCIIISFDNRTHLLDVCKSINIIFHGRYGYYPNSIESTLYPKIKSVFWGDGLPNS